VATSEPQPGGVRPKKARVAHEGADLSHLATLAATVLLAFGAASAMAQPKLVSDLIDENALTVLLPLVNAAALCYVSKTEPVTYPLEDIPARKEQRQLTISRFLFELKVRQAEDDDTVTPPVPGRYYYDYRMLAEVVGKKARLISAGECGSASADVFGCGSDCDGGTMGFEVAGTDALSMRVSDLSKRFRMSWGCGGGGAEGGRVEVLRHDPAAPAVRMEKAAPRACRPIARVFRRSRH
jgi:hypothetical protein